MAAGLVVDTVVNCALSLQDEVAAKPDLPECGPKSEGKKACKNCSCGYADELDKAALANGEVPQKSACGSVTSLLSPLSFDFCLAAFESCVC